MHGVWVIEQGLERGLEQGVEKGRHEGFEAGALAGQIQLLQQLLEWLFMIVRDLDDFIQSFHKIFNVTIGFHHKGVIL